MTSTTLDAACPIPADASQLEAIAAAVAGKTFVLEGPPGTGKSQTITNLLARAIAGGKRVLFVAEKRAALDVVRARLAAIGLSPFCLDLHDKSSKPAGVRAQILQALDLAPVTDEQGFTGSAKTSPPRAAPSTCTPADCTRRTPPVSPTTPPAPRPGTGGGDAGAAGPGRRAHPPHRRGHREPAALLGRLNETADLTRPARTTRGASYRGRGRPLKAAVRKACGRRLDTARGALRWSPLGAARDRRPRPLGTDRRPALDGDPDRRPAVGCREPRRGAHPLLGGPARPVRAGSTSFTASAPRVSTARDPMALNLPLDQIRAEVPRRSTRLLRPQEADRRRVRALGAVPLGRPKRQGGAAADRRVAVETRSRARPARRRVRGLARPARPTPWNPWDPAPQQELQGQIAWLLSVASAIDPGARHDTRTAALRSFLEADAMASPASWTTSPSCRSRSTTCQSGRHGSARTWLAGSAAHRCCTRSGGATERSRHRAQPALTPVAEPPAGTAEPLPRPGPPGMAADSCATASSRPTWRRRPSSAGSPRRPWSSAAAPPAWTCSTPGAHNMSVAGFGVVLGVGPRPPAHRHPAAGRCDRPFSATAERGQVNDLRRQLGRQRGGMKVRALLDSYGDLITQLMPCVLVSPDSVARFFPVGSQHLRPGRLRRGVADPRRRRGRGDRAGEGGGGRRRQQADAADVRRGVRGRRRGRARTRAAAGWSPITRAS